MENNKKRQIRNELNDNYKRNNNYKSYNNSYNNNNNNNNNNYQNQRNKHEYQQLTPKEREIIRAKDYLFNNIDKIKRKELQLDDVAIFSVTEGNTADKMTLTILSHLQRVKNNIENNNYSILDGMACVGGNTISFAKSFNKVISNEYDGNRYEMLRNNVQNVMNLNNVEFHNESILNLAFNESYDVLFLDPEWGGPDYKYKKQLKLTISDTPLEEFCLNVFNNCLNISIIALKLPVNYDNIYLRDIVESNNLSYTFDNTFHKMTLTIITRKLNTNGINDVSNQELNENKKVDVIEEEEKIERNDELCEKNYEKNNSK